jgi:GNAT superfamily N-acetyltransferase
VEAIARIINTAFQVERFFLDQDRISSEGVRTRMETGRFILAEVDHALAGCVYVEPRGERAYLGLLSVDPSRQRSGLGQLLMSAAEDHGRAAGCRFMDLLIVNLRQELPEYYRRLDYRENGTAPFPEGVHPKLPCHFLKMCKPLG